MTKPDTLPVTMLPSTLISFGVLVAAAGTPVALSTACKFPGLMATNLTIWPGKGANGRTANTGIVYLGFGYATAPQLGVPEAASATLLGNVTTAGNASVTVTSVWLKGSPLVFAVPVALSDTPTLYAAKIVTALNANAVFNMQFVASSVGAVLTVARQPSEGGEDSTLLVATATGTAVGITSVSTTITTVDVPVTVTQPVVWLPIAVAPTVPLQLFPDLQLGAGLDLSTIFVDAATSGDGITVHAILEPIR